MSTQRQVALGLGVVATVMLLWLVNPWVAVPEGLNQYVTIAFWIASIALLIALYLEARQDPESGAVEIDGPALRPIPVQQPRAGLFWLPIRLFVGFAWLDAGWHKFTDPEWTQGGAALRAYWERAAAIPERVARRSRTSVPRLHQHPARRRPRRLVRVGDHIRRTRHRDRSDLRDPHRHRSLLRGIDEHVLPVGRIRVDESRSVHPRSRAHARRKVADITASTGIFCRGSARHGDPERVLTTPIRSGFNLIAVFLVRTLPAARWQRAWAGSCAAASRCLATETHRCAS